MWRDRWKRHLTDMHGKIGICQDARKHKERGDGFCPRCHDGSRRRRRAGLGPVKYLGLTPLRLRSGQNRATAQPRNRATAQPRNRATARISAGSSFAENQAPSVAASVSAFSSFFDSQPSTFNPHQSLHHCKPTSASANGAMSSASQWRDEE
jgi:hypothetical protein